MTPSEKSLHRVLAGFVRMHVLHHAEEGELYGQWMMEELRHHGYKISPGTLYPMLKTMVKDGWLTSREEKDGNRRTLYRITPHGAEALQEVRAKLKELFNEVGKEGKKKKS